MEAKQKRLSQEVVDRVGGSQGGENARPNSTTELRPGCVRWTGPDDDDERQEEKEFEEGATSIDLENTE